jgi:ADP-heptose:LPS heptosyltransferase
MNKILFIAPYKGIGDLIFHLPLMRSFFKKYKCKIFLITSYSSQANHILKNEKYISKIIYINIARTNHLIKTYNLIKKINKILPDLSILTNSSKRFKISLFLSKSKKKIYFSRYRKEDLCNFLLKEFKKKFPNLKIKKNYKFNSNISRKKKDIFINIDTSDNHNNWPEDNYINLINNIFTNKFKRIYINFSPKNKIFFSKTLSYYKNMKNVFFTYKYNFNKVIKIISESQMVIGNESGPNCIAASSNVPLIISFYNSKKAYKSSKTINENVIFFKSNTSLSKIKKKIIFILNKKIKNNWKKN